MPKLTPFPDLALSLTSKLPPKLNLGGNLETQDRLSAEGPGETRGAPRPQQDYTLAVYQALQAGLKSGKLIAVLQDPYVVRFERVGRPQGLLQVTFNYLQYDLFLDAVSQEDTPLSIALAERGLL